MNELIAQIAALSAQVNGLEQRFNGLGDYSQIDTSQINALIYSGFLNIQTPQTGTYPHTTYGGAGTYDVPSQPTGTIAILINGTTYNIPYQ